MENEAPRLQQKASSSWEGITAILNAFISLLWFGLAASACYLLFPLVSEVLHRGFLNKIKVGIVEVELQHVPSRPLNLDVANGSIAIEESARKRISARFVSISEKLLGATVLWVDDNHPVQNVAERRVLTAAGINVDIARSTAEAIQWLARANYDILITDSDRSTINDPPQPCFPGAALPSTAGCALLQKVGGCHNGASHDFDCSSLKFRKEAKAPAMIVYSGSYSPEKGIPPYATGMTNRAEHLFDLVIDALAKRIMTMKSADL